MKELVHFCEKLPDTNSILVHDMRLKTVHMGHLKPEKKIAPWVTYHASSPKSVVKFHIFLKVLIDKSIFTG